MYIVSPEQLIQDKTRETTQERIVGERKNQTSPSDASMPIKKFFGPNVTIGLRKVVTLTGQKTFWRAKRLVVLIILALPAGSLT